MNGTQWDLKIYFSDDHKPVNVSGSYASPYNYGDLEDLLKVPENGAQPDLFHLQ